MTADSGLSGRFAGVEAPESVSIRVVRCGYAIAFAAAAIQTSLYLVNVYALDSRFEALDVDSAGEGNVFTWASSSATMGVAIFAIHERVGLKVVSLLGMDERYARVLWPTLMLPLLAFVAVILWRAGAGGSSAARRAVRLGVGLLVFAVGLELVLFLAPPETAARALFETPVVAAEEAVELAGWTLLAAGLGSLFINSIGSKRSAT